MPYCLHMAEKKDNKTLAIILIVGLAVAGFSFFLSFSVRKDMNYKLNTAENNLANLIETLGKEVQDIKRNLSLEDKLLESQVEALKEGTDKRIGTLAGVVDDLQSQSNQKLEDLKKELATIQVDSSDFSMIVEQVLPSVVSIQTDVGLGSGAIISKDGYIVTNYHVIKGASIARAVTYGKETLNARLVGVDINADVAVLQISGTHSELWFADTRSLKVGEKVIALGNPGGLDFTVTEGIISATKRVLNNGISYVQTDVPINPGNSGGPLVNREGRIVGINNFKISGFEGVGFAIDGSVVEEVVDAIIKADQEKNKP